MEYVIGTKVPLQRVTVTPFAVATSESNVIAAITLQGVHLFELLAAVNRKEPFQFDFKTIATPTECNPSHNSDINRTAINRDINFEEIHDIFLDRTLSAARTIDEPLTTAFRQVAWSPSGLIPYQKCVLATVTADHKVVLYRNGRWMWEEMDELSSRWLQYMRDNSWGSESSNQSQESNHSQVYWLHKTRSYILATMALAWSPLIAGTTNWAWLVTLQRSGHIVVWKAENPLTKLVFSTYHDLHLEEPSVLKLSRGPSENQVLLFAGSHRGFLKCWSLSWTDEAAPSCSLLGAVIPDEDHIPINAIEIFQVKEHLVISIVKNNALVVAAIKCDGNGLHCTDIKNVVLPGLQISGLTQLAGGNVVCVTEDYLVNEIDLTINSEGIFQGPEVKDLNIPSSQTMLCRGITTTYSGDTKTLFLLESVKVSYDHLKCRQPSSFTVYIVGDLQRVTNVLECAESMEKSLVALETYKALNGPNWETIWEMDLENMNSEDNYYLQLLRWFALYKCNAYFVERRYDKEMQDDLKSRAETAEFCLQVRHIQQYLTDSLNKSKDQLNDDQLIDISLAYQFINSKTVKDSDVTFDRSLAAKVKAKFKINKQASEECAVCQNPIPFEDRTEGWCSNGHKTLRCRSSLRTCFNDTFSCRWCGTHYHPKSGIRCCILCGGSLHGITMF